MVCVCVKKLQWYNLIGAQSKGIEHMPLSIPMPWFRDVMLSKLKLSSHFDALTNIMNIIAIESFPLGYLNLVNTNYPVL